MDMETTVDIVIDTSALLAVILGEPERDRIIELTASHTLIGPGSIPWEVGNAFSAMLKQDRLTIDDAQKGLAIFEQVPIQFGKPDFAHSLAIANQAKIYAYDAYVLDCAIRHKAPILTLDKKLIRTAKALNTPILEA
jgi:predicted nucleic acid-binding protein